VINRSLDARVFENNYKKHGVEVHHRELYLRFGASNPAREERLLLVTCHYPRQTQGEADSKGNEANTEDVSDEHDGGGLGVLGASPREEGRRHL